MDSRLSHPRAPRLWLVRTRRTGRCNPRAAARRTARYQDDSPTTVGGRASGSDPIRMPSICVLRCDRRPTGWRRSRAGKRQRPCPPWGLRFEAVASNSPFARSSPRRIRHRLLPVLLLILLLALDFGRLFLGRVGTSTTRHALQRIMQLDIPWPGAHQFSRRRMPTRAADRR